MLNRIVGVALLACVIPAPAIAAEHLVTLSNFSFTPRVLTIQQGDRVRWRNQSGCHDVTADDDSFSSGAVSCSSFEFIQIFDQPGSYGYYCTPHGSPGSGMAGTIVVEEAATPAFTAINRGINGSWYNPQTSGQGFLVEVFPAANIFTFAWFTWAGDGGYDWYVGNGSYADNVATLDVFRSSGGRFNDPAPVSSVDVGNATFTLIDCTHATFDFDISSPPRTGSIALTRILPPGPECVAPAAAAER